MSWYDRDRDVESPRHANECHQASATPGYIDCGIHHGATLRVDIEEGRFMFVCPPIDLWGGGGGQRFFELTGV